MIADFSKDSRTKGQVVLEIRNLRVEGHSDDNWLPILQGVDLTLRRGEVLGIIGESGAGKSTIGLAAMGYARNGCRFTGGTVMFDGIDLLAASEKQKRSLRGVRIAYVAQSAAASFNPAHRLLKQTIEVAIRNNLKSRAEAEADVKILYKQLKLPNPEDIGSRYPHQVSGGQLQRVMMALAMSCRPDVIVLDEPTTALDVTTQVEVLSAIRDIVEKFNTAAIYITHDLAVVSQMAHRIIVLRNGKTVEEAPTREMLRNPRADYTRSLWAVRNLRKIEEPSDDSILRIHDVSAAYSNDTRKVLDGVSLSVPRGRTVAIVGESGSGKSTIARVMTGLLPPLSGDIYFNGRLLPATLEARDREILRRIQMVYQSPDTALNPRHTVRELIGRPLQFYSGLQGGALERRIVDLIEMIDLDENHLERLPGELSGGQKQRVSLARALAADPDVIICDEVTSALDQLVQEEILKLLLRLQKELGLSYVFITHDIAAVRAIADEIVVMHQGRVIEQGMKSEVLEPPYPEYTKLLLSSVPEMDPDWLTRLLVEREGYRSPSENDG